MNLRSAAALVVLLALAAAGAFVIKELLDAKPVLPAQTLWEVKCGGTYRGMQTDEDGNVYLVNQQGQLQSYNRGGTLRFSQQLDASQPFSARLQLTSDGRLMAIFEGDNLLRGADMDPDPPLELRIYTKEGRLLESLSCAGDVEDLFESGGRFFGIRHSTRLVALDAEMKDRWSFLTGSSIYPIEHAATHDQYYLSGADGNVYCLSPDGELLWYLPGSIFGDTLFSNGDILINPGRNVMRRVDASGKVVWSHQLSESHIFQVDKQDCIIASGEDSISRFSPEGRRLWRREVGGEWNSALCQAQDGSSYWMAWGPDDKRRGLAKLFRRKQPSMLSNRIGRILALSADGEPMWSLDLDQNFYPTSEAPAPDGDIYLHDYEKLVRVGR